MVSDLPRAVDILKAVNWSFYQKGSASERSLTPFKCNRHHWYPATFVPEIPFTLIEVLSLPRAVVYDPFAGCGTTYFQALILGRKPLATEINSVAVALMRAFFVLFNPTLDRTVLKSHVEELVGGFTPETDYTRKILDLTYLPELRPWYSKDTLNKLCYLFLNEHQTGEDAIKAIIRIVTSSIMKTASSQERGWGCIADNMHPREDQIKDKDVLGLFSKRAGHLLKDVEVTLQRAGPEYADIYDEVAGSETIFHENVFSCTAIPAQSVDLVVTSPPYPNMTDYVNSQRLSYYYMGIEMRADLDLEIGARIRRFRKDSLDQYYKSMLKANSAIVGRLKRGGYACYVLPVFDRDTENNTRRRNILDKVLAELNKDTMVQEDIFDRILPTRRRSHNQSWACLEKEKIYLYRKA